jgi:hypothetical protein
MSLGGMPYHYVKDRYGDQVALPCTERNLTQAKTQATIARGYMPVISVKGRDEVRLGSFQALNGETILGYWVDVPPPKPKADVEEEASDDTASDDTASDDGDSGDADLDALLAGFGDDFGSSSSDDDDASAPDPDAEEEMDADLAALLASL